MHTIQIITLRVKSFMDLMILEEEGTLKKKGGGGGKKPPNLF